MVSVELDHVAVALNDVEPVLKVLVGELGAPILFGGANFGFKAMQVDCNLLKIELLEPHNVEQNDFLKRFLESNGEGPHHLTFKTDDIRALLARIEEAGYHPVGVNIDNPFWREAFIHPKEAGGTVVQVAQSDMDPMEIDPSLIPEQMREYGPSKWWPEVGEPASTKATLDRVVVTTDEMSVAIGLYRDLLDGTGAAFGEGWSELAWPGGGRIRIEAAAGRPQGIDRLEWSYDGPTTERVVGGTRFCLNGT
jgi:hypothetical protein